MLKDTTPLARVAGARVIGEHVLVEWPDGSHVRVHQVHRDRDGADLLAVRAPDGSGATWLVFEAADIDVQLAHDLRQAHWHDHLGIVLYSLRLRYPDAQAFFKALLTHQAREALGRAA
jgi:hypothetical protein